MTGRMKHFLPFLLLALAGGALFPGGASGEDDVDRLIEESGIDPMRVSDAISKGVVDLRDLVFFASLIGFWLFANALLLEIKKAD